MLIPDFWKWLKYNFSGEIHHFFGNNRLGGRYDCFICVIPPELHREIHFGSLGVRGYIEREGEHNLIRASMELLQDWVDESSSFEYQCLIDAVLNDIDMAIDIAKGFDV